MDERKIVSREQWLILRRQLLAEEKELTQARDRLSERRRELPWTLVEKEYVFDSAEGPRTLAELFADKSQLVVYHLMFGPDAEVPCKNCAFWADHYNGMVPHLAARDVAFTAVSRAPLTRLEGFARRMGWTFPWVSSNGSDFNYDYGVSFTREQLGTGTIAYNYGSHRAHGTEMPGISVFYKERETVFHTYSCYARGIELLNASYQALDLVPKGRAESGLPFSMAWVHFHDDYAR
jgi:predicted dithiol-disulfide oxidoreductase (DUF899 family)